MQVFTWSSGISPDGSITQHFRFGSSSALGASRKKQDHVELGIVWVIDELEGGGWDVVFSKLMFGRIAAGPAGACVAG
jgi:hypothetical protein